MQTIQTCGLSDDFKHVCFKDLEGYLNVDNFLDVLKGFSELEINEIRRTLGINPKVNIDPQLNQYSTNPVANSAIFCALQGKVDKNRIANIAITGQYKDLKGAPCSLPNPEGLVIQDSNGQYKIYDGTEAVKITIPQSLKDFSDWKEFYVDYSKIEDLVPLKSITLNGVALPVNDDKSVSITTLTWEEVNKKLQNYISQDDWCVIKAKIEQDYIFKIKESEVKLCNKIKQVNADLQTQINGINSMITDLRNKLDVILVNLDGNITCANKYPLTVKLSVTPNQFNKLQALRNYTVNWSTNYQDIANTKLYINNELQKVSGNSFSVSDANIQDDVNIRIIVENSKNNSASDFITIKGYYPIFYGLSSDYKQNNSVLMNSSSGSFTVNAGTNDYIYIISPKALIFYVGGFEGGFAEQNTITISDSNNQPITYHVYRSDNKNLGNTTVTWQQN